MKLSEGNLQQIKNAARTLYKDSHNINIAADLYPLACFIQAFVDFCARNGQTISVELPSRQPYQSVDDITD